MSRVHRAATWVSRALLVAGVLSLAYVGHAVMDARTYQATQLRAFDMDARRPAPAAAPVEGDVVGEMVIPRLGIAVVLAEGESPAILRRAVGHVAGTALPGETGNVVLAGHRDTFFRPLKGVRVGDAIAVRTHAGDFAYLVESTRVVGPDDIGVLQSTGGRTLTLITCFPFSYVGPAPDRFVVRARQSSAR